MTMVSSQDVAVEFQTGCKIAIADLILTVSRFDEDLIRTINKLVLTIRPFSSTNFSVGSTISNSILGNMETLKVLLRKSRIGNKILPEVHKATQNLCHALTIRNFIAHNRVAIDYCDGVKSLLLSGVKSDSVPVGQERSELFFYSSPEELNAVSMYFEELQNLIDSIPTWVTLYDVEGFDLGSPGSEILSSSWPLHFRVEPYPWQEFQWPDVSEVISSQQNSP